MTTLAGSLPNELSLSTVATTAAISPLDEFDAGDDDDGVAPAHKAVRPAAFSAAGFPGGGDGAPSAALLALAGAVMDAQGPRPTFREFAAVPASHPWGDDGT